MAAHTTRRILIVDDDRALRHVLAELLKAAGHTVDQAADGHEALGRLDAGAYDIVLLDISLPGVSGLDLLEHARAAASPPIVIMMTADDTPEMLLAAVRRQAYRYLRKPFAPSAIVEVVDEAISRASSAALSIEVVSARPEWVELVAPCVLEMADRIQQFVMQLDTNLPEPVRESVAQAFRELMTNAIEWGGKLDPQRKVRISCVRAKRMLLYRIADPGEGFDIDKLRHAAINNPDTDPLQHAIVREEQGLRPGGLGMMITRSLVDDVIYNEKRNEVMLIKYLIESHMRHKPSRPPAITRRQFGAAVSALPIAATAARASARQDDVAGLYSRSIVIDALANPGSMNVSWPPRGPLSQKQRDAIAASGITAINVTVSADFEGSVRNIALWQGEADKYPALLSIVRRHADIAKAKQDKTLGLMLGFQNTDMIDRDISRLDLFYRLGIRITQLTYNDRNLVGDGCLEAGNAGLSAFGRQVVERMNTLGIAVDLSHCGTQTTADGIAASTKPPLITHSGCREVFRHPRSKEDRELKAMADKGGVVGIYFMPFIGPGPGAPTTEMLMRQIDHAIKVCGVDHVGIGSDLSTAPIDETPEYLREHTSFVDARAKRGISAPEESRPLFIPELNHPRRLEGVVRGMRQRKHSTEVIEKVIGGNFHRVFKEIWTL